MGQHQPLIWWILLLDINIPLLKKKLEREGVIIELSYFTVLLGYLMERYVLVDPFASTMSLLLG